jgi:uncharacterized membrane protein
MPRTDTIILTSAIVTLSSTTAAAVLPRSIGGRQEVPEARLLFGTALSFVGLSFLGEFVPQVAGPLALTIALTALTYYGVPLADNVFNNHHNAVGSYTTAEKARS